MATTDARGAEFASRVEGVERELHHKTMEKGVTSSDSGLGFNNPFGEQERRSSADENAFSKQRSNDESLRDVSGSPPEGLSPEPKSRDRSMSKEWDASKVPPSRFQKRKGSIYSTPNSRDGHVQRKERDSDYHAKLKEKGWN